MDLSLALTLGVIGSLHCLQMCGPLVVACSLPLAGQSRSAQFVAQLAYNAGRVATYAVLGAIAGAVGSAVGFAGRLAGIEQAAAILAGLLLLVAAAAMGGLRAGRPDGQISVSIRRVFRPASFLSRSVARLVDSRSPLAKGAMGLMLGFLPCGLVYAALVQAAATSAPWRGALTMAAFGLGTSGALLALGLCSLTVGRWFGRWSTRAAAMAVAVTGLLILWRAAMAPHAGHLAGHAAGL